ncbi:MAG TPA: ATP-grasp domain-containing protein [Usitatibacter sp.]|nr:ATP-grasp domain-containing protein [Usitatibacter sp.]
MTHPTICLVCPTMWDEAELPGAAARAGIPYRPHGTDVSEDPGAFDALSFIDATAALIRAENLSGVLASDDYPGSIVAAALAHELRFPGPSPEAVLRCQHKFYGRLAQRESVPEAVPDFTLVDPGDIESAMGRLRFPVFVKPVKSFFSLFARTVHDRHGLESLARAARAHLDRFVKPLDQLLARHAPFAGHGGGYLIAETPLQGQQVTLEACVFRGELRIVGIVDSIMYPGTISFARFEYPSALPAHVQARMGDIAARFVRHIGFDDGLFNIEMMYDPDHDTVHIIEVNPRMCPQFADLMEKVNGVNTYEIALSIAAGRRPVVRREGAQFAAAASIVGRVFVDCVPRRVPGPAEVERLRERFPDARLKVLCREGHRLSGELQDGNSFRYALLNLGGDSREHIAARHGQAMRMLHFDLQPVGDEALSYRRGRGRRTDSRILRP